MWSCSRYVRLLCHIFTVQNSKILFKWNESHNVSNRTWRYVPSSFHLWTFQLLFIGWFTHLSLSLFVEVIVMFSVRSGEILFATCQLSVVFKPLAVKSSQPFNKQKTAILKHTGHMLWNLLCPCREDHSLMLALCTHNQYTHTDSFANSAQCLFIQHVELYSVYFLILGAVKLRIRHKKVEHGESDICL